MSKCTGHSKTTAHLSHTYFIYLFCDKSLFFLWDFYLILRPWLCKWIYMALIIPLQKHWDSMSKQDITNSLIIIPIQRIKLEHSIYTYIFIKHRTSSGSVDQESSSITSVHLRVQTISNLTVVLEGPEQVGIDATYGRLHMYIQGSPAETQIPTH